MAIYVKENNKLKLLSGVITSNSAVSSESNGISAEEYDAIYGKVNEIATKCENNYQANKAAIDGISERLGILENSGTGTQQTSNLDDIQNAINSLSAAIITINERLDNISNGGSSGITNSDSATITNLTSTNGNIVNLTSTEANLKAIKSDDGEFDSLGANTAAFGEASRKTTKDSVTSVLPLIPYKEVSLDD